MTCITPSNCAPKKIFYKITSYEQFVDNISTKELRFSTLSIYDYHYE